MKRAMRTALSWIGRALILALIALCFAPTLIPPFLDRVYYDGPPSDHYDGARFVNPGPAQPGRRASILDRWGGSEEQAVWPSEVPVRPTVPPRRIEGGEMVVTWIGHSTVLVQTEGLNILTDPVWSDRVSPFSFAGPRRVRAPGVRFEDLPRIDLVLVSHNHYDHLDLATLRRLWERDRPLIVTGLGNDTLMRAEGIEATALDWGEVAALTETGLVREEGIPRCDPDATCPGDRAQVISVRNYHWTSRWLTDRNRALWSAFTVRTPSGAIFFAGDTGWGDGSWARDATRFGPYRLAILPIGAYSPRAVMRGSHIDPEEALAVFDILRPTMAIAMHWGTFQLSWEEIDAPPRRLAELRRARAMPRDRFAVTEVGQSFRVPPLGR